MGRLEKQYQWKKECCYIIISKEKHIFALHDEIIQLLFLASQLFLYGMTFIWTWKSNTDDRKNANVMEE